MGDINDFESGESSTEETKNGFYTIIFDKLIKQIQDQQDYKQSILALVDVEIDKHKAMQKKYLDNNLEYYGLAGAKISTLTELKQKIQSL